MEEMFTQDDVSQRQREDFVEVLTWWFPTVNMSSTTLAIQWGHTYVPLDMQVQPTVDLTVSPEVAAQVPSVSVRDTPDPFSQVTESMSDRG